MTSIAQINENEQREIRGSLKKFFAEYHLSGTCCVWCFVTEACIVFP